MRTRARIQQVGVFAAVACAALTRVTSAQDVSLPAVYLHLGGQRAFRSEVLHEAEAQVTRIYRQAGIDTVWMSDYDKYDPVASPVPGPLLNVLIRSSGAVVPNRSDSLVGLALGAESGRATMAFVFADAVRRAARKYEIHHVTPAHVLAMAIAHEVGHLLLPAGHSNAGVMRANWDARDFALAVRGTLLFSAQQGELMRARLQQRQDTENANDHRGVLYSRVRSTDKHLIAVVRGGYDRSPAFRALVDTIQDSNVIVMVQPGLCAGGRIRSCLVSVSGSVRDRHIRIKIDPRHTIKDWLIASVAHELQHAVEIAEQLEVTDGPSALKLYRRIAFGLCSRGLSEECETTRALDSEKTVLRELFGRK